MSIRTADNKETALRLIVKFPLHVQGIIRPVQAFCGSSRQQSFFKFVEFPSGHPVAYQVDASIRIREFAVTIRDKNIGEPPRDIAEAAELGFSKGHTLIMYPRAVLK